MPSNAETLQIIKNKVAQILPGSELILFGSRARNDNSIDSDYDLLIITPQSLQVPVKREYKTKIRKELLKFNILSDILIESNSEIKAKRLLPGHIVKNALKEGVKI